jgi:predicted nucleotidyltransferase
MVWVVFGLKAWSVSESMVVDAHGRAVSYLVSKCSGLAVVSVLVYGSYARGDYRPDSDVDVLVVVDSSCYCSVDLKSLVDVCVFCKRKFKVVLQMDVILDCEIDLWNRGILLDGHSFVDLSFYRKEGRVVFGVDVRDRFRVPVDFRDKARDVLGIVESEFKRWFCQAHGRRRFVPHWLTGWLFATFLNVLGWVDVASFSEMCRFLGDVSVVASSVQFRKYREKRELTADEFIDLLRLIKGYVK